VGTCLKDAAGRFVLDTVVEAAIEREFAGFPLRLRQLLKACLRGDAIQRPWMEGAATELQETADEVEAAQQQQQHHP
jgi:hypothetical protein